MATKALTKKAEKTTGKIVDFVDANYQTILVVLAVSVGGYLIYRSVKGINDVSKKVGDEISFDGTGEGGAGTQTPINGQTTITENQASVIAALLLSAMDGFGTDEDSIYDALAGKTPADYAMISNAFGTPRYDGAGHSHWPFPKRNLTEWLTRELNQSEIEHLANLMPGVFVIN